MFDLLSFILLLLFLHGIPGAIIGLSAFHNTKLSIVEKIIAGIGISIFLVPLFPFLLFLIFGIKFTYPIAILSLVGIYAIAIGLFVMEYGIRKISDIHKVNPILIIKKLFSDKKCTSDKVFLFSQLFLLILIFVSVGIRISGYTAVHFELDPYYYIYVGRQIITQGYNPLDDKTAWYPEVSVNHRWIPSLGYLEAVWYSLYVGDAGAKAFDKFLYATITSIYPGIAAGLSIFFLYMFIMWLYKGKWWARWVGLLVMGIVSFTPTFFMKTIAGIMEAQPYAFYSIAMFSAFTLMALSVRKNLLFGVIAGLGASAVILGSSSGMFVKAFFLFYPYLISTLYLIKKYALKKETSAIYQSFVDLVKQFSVIYIVALISILCLFFFSSSRVLWLSSHTGLGLLYNLILYPFISFLPFGVVFLLLSEDKKNNIFSVIPLSKEHIFVGSIAIASIVVILVLFVPSIGDPIINAIFTPISTIKQGLAIAQFNVPLARTIAEQPQTGASLQGSLGFIAAMFKWDKSNSLLTAVFFIPSILSSIMDASIGAMYSTLDIIFSSNIGYIPKAPNMLYVLLFFIFISFIWMFYKEFKYGNTYIILILTLFIPSFLIGIMKVKYTIYLGFFVALGIGVMFSEVLLAVESFAGRKGGDKGRRNYFNYAQYFVLVLLFGIFVGQFYSMTVTVDNGSVPVIPAMISTMFSQQFDQNPSAFKSKFSKFVEILSANGLSDKDICTGYLRSFCSIYDAPLSIVANDPEGYANSSIINRYSPKYCVLSLMSDPLKPSKNEIASAVFRCNFINPYWLDSMEWISKNVENDTAVISWWDYGHWINYFGDRNTVLRNEHASHKMITEVAYLYTQGTPEELATYMREHNSKYAIFDVETSGIFGGKYGALNYLGCAYANKTDVTKAPGMSACEAKNLWETVFVPASPTDSEICKVSEMPKREGVVAYLSMLDVNGAYVKRRFVPRYCFAMRNVSGGKSPTLYYLDKKYPDGSLYINKADLIPKGIAPIQGAYGSRRFYVFDLMYTNTTKWLVNGTLVSGISDAEGKGGFYKSNIYRAFYLKDLPGFELVYETKDKAVKIFKLKD